MSRGLGSQIATVSLRLIGSVCLCVCVMVKVMFVSVASVCVRNARMGNGASSVCVHASVRVKTSLSRTYRLFINIWPFLGLFEIRRGQPLSELNAIYISDKSSVSNPQSKENRLLSFFLRYTQPRHLFSFSVPEADSVQQLL